VKGPVLRRPEIVCVLASTGGPNALSRFLATFSDTPAVPFVIVQHMPTGFTGRLADRLATLGPFVVREAAHGGHLEPGVALVAPAGVHLRFAGTRIRLTSDPPIGGLRPRADLTLEDLARDHGDGVLAVVLTGMGDDGLLGCEAVVRAGGQVLAQDGVSTAVDGMPRRVREAGLATVVASPVELAAAVASACGARATGRRGDDPAPPPLADDRDATSVTASALETTAPSPALLDAVRRVMADTEDANLDSLRDSYMSRRLAVFARRHALPLDGRLVDALREDAELRSALLGRLHIHVTSFFRDLDHWTELDETIMGQLPMTPRVWSAGCADGSEAYSLALLALEHGRRPRVWATDVDDGVLEKAASGRYRDGDARDVPDDLLRRYFRVLPAGGVEVRSDLRAMVDVERHDALHDPLPHQRFDLVACRNLVIYLGDDGRERLYRRLAEAVRPGGVLFTGAADSFHDPSRFGFVHVGRTLFRRIDDAAAGPARGLATPVPGDDPRGTIGTGS
jgi:two-component system CheB/CheR fusion protein